MTPINWICNHLLHHCTESWKELHWTGILSQLWDHFPCFTLLRFSTLIQIQQKLHRKGKHEKFVIYRVMILRFILKVIYMHTSVYFRVAGYFQYALMYRFIHHDVQVNGKKPLFFLVAFTNVKQSISSTHLIPHLTDCLPWNVCDVACQFSLPFDQ